MALQTAIAVHTLEAMRFTCLAMMGTDNVTRIRIDAPHGDDRILAPEVAPILAKCRETLGMKPAAGDDLGFLRVSARDCGETAEAI